MMNGVHFWQKIIFLLGYRWTVRLEIHNQYRVTKGGRPTHKLVMRALTLLQNIMSTITC